MNVADAITASLASQAKNFSNSVRQDAQVLAELSLSQEYQDSLHNCVRDLFTCEPKTIALVAMKMGFVMGWNAANAANAANVPEEFDNFWSDEEYT